MKIGILGAMPEEVNLIKTQLMRITKETTLGQRTYIEGTIHHIPVVLVFSRWGKVASAISTSTLINTFNVDKIIFTGVAGAVSPTLNIGDIVISNQLYQHDMDASPFFSKHQIPLTDDTFFDSCQHLVKQSKIICEHFLAHIQTIIPSPTLLNTFSITTPQCHIGLIASGDQFINSTEKTAELLSHQPQTLAVDMESAAVAQACHDHHTPFVIIRVISDKADHSAPIDFPTFIESIASQYTKYIIHDLLQPDITHEHHTTHPLH